MRSYSFLRGRKISRRRRRRVGAHRNDRSRMARPLISRENSAVGAGPRYKYVSNDPPKRNESARSNRWPSSMSSFDDLARAIGNYRKTFSQEIHVVEKIGGVEVVTQTATCTLSVNGDR